MQDKCAHCKGKLKEFCFSAKFNKTFCGQKCYVDFRKSLDPNWEDKPIYQVKGGEVK